MVEIERTTLGYAPLLACYGGGHAQIIGPIAKEMARRGMSPTVLGFTTAYRALERMGINAISVEALVEDDDAAYLTAMEPFLSGEHHPDVSPEQTRAYYGLGFRDLALQVGWDRALAMVVALGRKAFEPVGVMSRFLSKMRPDIVIATTSPRFELALLKAARQSGTPSLAIGDLFLTHEREYILAKAYAENIAVLSEEVALDLVTDGFPRSHIRVTGNPAFDTLAPGADDARRRFDLRAQLGLAEKTVILWPAASTAVAISGKPFYSIDDVALALEALCRSDPSFAYIIRTHPNTPNEKPDIVKSGIFDNGKFTLEDTLLIADVVCFEVSTVGLQAILCGKPAITVGFADEMPFGSLGLALSVETIDAAIDVLRARSYVKGGSLNMPSLGHATANVLDFIDDILCSGRPVV